jgi:hypothetical protein
MEIWVPYWQRISVFIPAPCHENELYQCQDFGFSTVKNKSRDLSSLDMNFTYLIIMKEHGLRVFENMVAKENIWIQWKVTTGWIKLQSEELHTLYSSLNIIMEIK